MEDIEYLKKMLKYLDNDEYSEYIELLIKAYDLRDCMGMNFWHELEDEISGNAEWLRDNTEIKEIVITPEPYTEKKIIYK